MEKEQKIVPNYVVISPHTFQNNKAVEVFAKHISLTFAAIFLACMVLSQFNTEHNFWFLFLPQFIYFSIVYIFGRISNSKTFHIIQIAMALILLPPSLYAIKHFLPHQRILLLITLCLLVIYPLILHIVYRKHYTKDLSTAETVSTLNTVDTCLTVFFLTYFLSFFVVRDLLRILLPQFDSTPVYQNGVVQFLFRYPSVILACFIINGCRGAFMMHLGTKKLNSKKTPALIEAVEIDCDGRAWVSAYSSIVYDFLKLKRRSLKSGVRPEESVELPLKQDVEN